MAILPQTGSNHVKKKRNWSQHGRLERTRSKLAVAAESCRTLDEFFPVLNHLEIVMKQNEKLKKELMLALKRVPADPFDGLPLGNIMRLLLECAKANAGKKRPGWRYSDTIKELGTMFLILSGPLSYDILSAGMPFPSPISCRRYLYEGEVIKEGEFRFAKLKKRMEGLSSNKIWCSEVNGRIQFDLKTNQIVGFVPAFDEHGCPVVDGFPAVSSKKIASYFDSGTVSQNVYVIMARPLAPNSPPFCLALFGTDNRFNSSHVDKRWDWMTQEAQKHNIEIVGFSSDGDAKLLKTMYGRTFVLSTPPRNRPWYHAKLATFGICIQDAIHALMKLRSKALKESDITPFGNSNIASRGHLVELIRTVTKDQHELAMSVIDVKDKMNFRSAQKLCAKKVSELLRKHVPNSEGTATFLDMMREFTDAFMDRTMSPLERISLVWKWIFFLRLWRQWLKDTPGYTLGHNFITSNCYTCMEINAHGLINLIQKFRDEETPELFQPWLFSSQDCEEFFKAGRSLTSTFSTITNFSILEFKHKVRRIDFLADSMNNLKDIIEFPRLKRTYRTSKEKSPVHILPEDFEIDRAVDEAFKSALKMCVKFGIAKPSTKCPPCPLESVRPNVTIEIPVDDDDPDIDGDFVDFDDEEGEENQSAAVDAEEAQEAYSQELQDVEEDRIMISTGNLGVKTFTNVSLSPDSPFVEVLDGNGKASIILKSTLVWRLSDGYTKSSSDREVRVKEKPVDHTTLILNSQQRPQRPFKEEKVCIGDWCAFVSEDKSVVIGRILAFSYLSGSTWRSQSYSAVSAPVKAPSSSSQRGIGCLCSWFKVGKSNKLQTVRMDIQGYYDIENYICTVPRPRAAKSDHYVMRCSMKDILSFKS